MSNFKFIKKFAKPELKFIAGKRYVNLIVLSVILIISMLAIGLGKGAVQYLDEKMNSPFVSFVNVKIPANSPYRNIKQLEKIHNNNRKDTVSLSDSYGFNTPYPIYYRYANFWNERLKKNTLTKVKRVKEDDPIYKAIIDDPKNSSIVKDNDFKVDGWGCVVSHDFLQNDETKLTYDDISNIAYLKYRTSIDNKDKFINIPIQGFVKSFPDEVDMIVGKKLFDAMFDKNYLVRLAHPDSAIAKNGYMQYYVIETDSLLSNYLSKNDFKEIDIDGIIHNTGAMYKKSNLSVNEKKTLVSSIPKNNSYNVLDFHQPHLPIDQELKGTLEGDNFVFEFAADKFEKIEEFNSFLKKNTLDDRKHLKIDMRIIESKKNFDLFNKLANLLSVALIAFCIFCLWLYITNLIVSHISKNKKNLGTLKAFGLSNNNIILIYSSISIALITIAFVLSYAISKLLGPEFIKLLASKWKIGDASLLNYKSYPIYTLAAFFIVLPSIVIYLKLWWQLRKSTPGDLIYERE